ncbi:glycoside hydrolase family protein [Olivibacter sp. SDN3]|uniref:glycoside hydrolase family protein n=1 Tax=Olivibacter sp. SDN3 TaxID=2764720 RepID=UPI0016514E6B|nr:glycoside hydrolase family protein [Olivibacter sp. SDN3]QNL50738.1 glycoside hydrolase family protein [Olivibacter sp. SDN3]
MKSLFNFLYVLFIASNTAYGQVVERLRPASWDSLVVGARFIDRFLPMEKGKQATEIWGAKGVQSRYVDNGIEDSLRSYWCGSIAYDSPSNLYHLYVCGWDEKSVKGHAEWPNSITYHAVSKQMNGPYSIRDTIGPGHNAELYRAKNGTYVLYVIDKRYTSFSLNGPWKQDIFTFDKRDRKIIEGLSNLTFAQRSDGAYLMVCRGGGIWFSTDGLSPYYQVTDRRVYPAVDGEFEDPVVWRDHVQYHLIVNDWLGRVAFYLRSKDGVHWVTDPGEAYTPQIALHEDGAKEAWFKFERMKIFQDQYGRAIQANFAVIDVPKEDDKGDDNHSSKNIAIPLNPGLLITILNQEMPTNKTKTIRVKIHSEPDFDPEKEVDAQSLRFGASTQVNFGKGCRVISMEKDGSDLIVTFDATAHGITEKEFAPKLIGNTKQGKLLYGYARAPWLNYKYSILSARKPVLSSAKNERSIRVEIQNFGEVASKKGKLLLYRLKDKEKELMASSDVSSLAPFEKLMVYMPVKKGIGGDLTGDFEIVIDAENDAKAQFSFSMDDKNE